MIEKERLEELIEQGATVYELYMNKNILEIQLKTDWFVMQDGLYERKLSKHPFRSWQIGNLYETKEDAEFVREFGCIERTENLKLLPYEEICDGCGYDFVFSTPNHCRVTMFIGENEIFMYKGISSCWSWELTKENYTLACGKCKELFLGENNNDK